MYNTFKTMVNLDLLLDRNGNYEINTKTAEIIWDLETDVRSWGVKDLLVTAPDQHITVVLSIWGENGTEDVEEILTLDVKDIVIEGTLNISGSVVPKTLSYFKNKWTLSF